MSTSRSAKRLKITQKSSAKKMDSLSQFLNGGTQKNKSLFDFFDDRSLARLSLVSKVFKSSSANEFITRGYNQLVRFIRQVNVDNPHTSDLNQAFQAYKKEFVFKECLQSLAQWIDSPLSDYLTHIYNDVKKTSFDLISEPVELLLNPPSLRRQLGEKTKTVLDELQTALNNKLHKYLQVLVSLKSPLKQSEDLIRCYTQRGADVNDRTRSAKEKSVLMLATELGNPEIVTLLIDAGANVNQVLPTVKEPWGEGITSVYISDPALMIAAKEYKAAEVADILINRGANLNYVNHFDETPLLLALRYDNYRFVSLILTKYIDKIDVNHVNDDGETALMLAAWRDHSEFIKILLEDSGADISLKDKRGRTALDIAVDDEYERALEEKVEYQDTESIELLYAAKEALKIAKVSSSKSR